MQLPVLRAFFCICLLLALSGCQKDYDVVVAGQVVNVLGEPVEKVTVTLRCDSGIVLSATTDQSGRFEFVESHISMEDRNRIRERELFFNADAYKSTSCDLGSIPIIGKRETLFCIVVKVVIIADSSAVNGRRHGD